MSAGPALSPHEAWARMGRGELMLVDVRTDWERERFGRVPGARDGSFVRSVLRPVRDPRVAYLCHGAVRTKLPAWRGAREVAGGLVAWRRAGLPVERGS